MKKSLIKGIRRCAAALLCGIMAAALCVPILAEEPRVLRVAFPQVEGITETAEDGTRCGLVVDYLNEIAKYTGWEYEYIDTTGDTMIEEFLAGDYDLMGGTYYAPGFEEYFAYPEYNTGYSKAVLLARQDDSRIRSYDLESLNGMVIGVYERAKENISRLKDYLTVHSLDCELRYLTYEEFSSEGNLYPYLINGEVDLLLGNNGEASEPLRAVTSFDSQPHYIVTNVGNQEVLNGLNFALGKIVESNPNFSSERYAANFPQKVSADIQLNEEEQEYIRQKKVVSVVVPENYHPLFCLDSPGELHEGLIPDILKEISRYSDLQFAYVHTASYSEAIRMVQAGEADMLCFFHGTEQDSVQQGLTLTSSYVNMNSILVRNKATSYPAEGLRGAVIEGQKLPGDITAAEVRQYSNVTEALSAVNRGEADFFYGLAARLEWDIQQHHFSNLVPVTLVNDRSDLSFALGRPADTNLLTVMNKAINRMTAEEKAAILNRNLVSIGTNNLTLSEIIYANPVMFIAVLSAFLLIVVVAVLWINRARTRAAVMQSHLEKAEAESRAKGEFLSRMSHEIRTPMNAVMGLVDVTSMMENVPEAVQGNLAKIRSSSRYLLDLINDILDMSRIDSGMLSVASEPFSLERMLDELQGMMESEARRRGLTYTQEREIQHSGLTGDVIRLRQVLTNLLSNAFKFTAAGGSVLLRVRETASNEAEATFLFQVIDTGIGISQEHQQRIFSSFEQVGTNISKSQGTGLGLPISRSIVQMMGGELGVKSENGQGSEFFFTVTLPFGIPPEEPPEAGMASSRLLAGISVLLAEDNDLNAEIAMQLLEIQGASVERRENGRLVLERFRESAPGEFQVILMDIQMPEMNGLEATRAIRALPHPDAASVPIVAMTANSFKEDVDGAMAAGMNGFISKPLDVNYLYSLMHSLVKKKTGS